MDYLDYAKLAGGWFLMYLCLLGNFAGAYLKGYTETLMGTFKRYLVFTLATTVIFCFFYVKRSMDPVILTGAMLVPLQGLIVGQVLLLLYLVLTATTLIADRAKPFQNNGRFGLTYENELMFLATTHTIVIMSWLYTVV